MHTINKKVFSTLQEHLRYISTKHLRQCSEHYRFIACMSLHSTKFSLLYITSTTQVNVYTVHKNVICTLQVHCRYISTQFILQNRKWSIALVVGDKFMKNSVYQTLLYIAATYQHCTWGSIMYTTGTLQVHLYTLHKAVFWILQPNLYAG